MQKPTRQSKKIGAKFDIEYQGILDNYIGVNIKSLPGGMIKLSQSHMIDKIVQDKILAQRASPRSTPAKSSVILWKDL